MSNLKGQIHLVTGATSGIGTPTAIELATQGATVVIVGRDAKRTEATVREVKALSENDSVDYLLADLSSQASIHELADSFKKKYDHLDVLVNNAGGIFMERKLTGDGIEWTLAVNHLAYFLLTYLLMDSLKAAPKARIVNVSSEAHKNTQIDFANLQGEKKYTGWGQYGVSKLANVMFTYELARKLKDTSITTNCLHPGVISTGFLSNNGRFWSFVMKIATPFLLTPEKGAATTIYLASSPEAEGVSGKYFDKKRAVRSSTVSYDEDVQKKLWQASEALTKVTF